jgi:hypothetical protein
MSELFGEGFWEGIQKAHNRMDDEFRRLCCEPSAKTPTTGCRVLVAAGLLGMGHPWIRLEATVIECGDTSYKVRFTDYRHVLTKELEEKWVHQSLITDVLA